MLSGQLKAGFGKREMIFPPEMFPIEGFTGIHDHPCARVMILESEGIRAVIAALEMVNVPPEGIELCRRRIEEVTQTDRRRIWVHVTHAISTMHEPGYARTHMPLDERDIQQKKMYYDALEKAVTEAAKQASLRFGKARIGWGSGKCDVNVNRDVETPFGWWNGQNPDGPSNKTMTVLRVEDPEGRPKGFFISYGIKPCAIDNAGMETGTRKISADVCGVCSRIMEEKFHVPAVFCVSAAADQVPKEQAWWEEADGEGRSVVRDLGAETGLAIAEKLGGMMGQNAVSIAESVECTENTAKLCHSAVSFMWKTKSGRPAGPGASVKEYPEEGECRVEAEIMTLGDTAFIAEKPEINCRTELELQEQSPYVRTLIICMVNGNMKYMPDRSAYERNTFEAQSSMLQPGAAERFVKETVSELNRMAKR